MEWNTCTNINHFRSLFIPLGSSVNQEKEETLWVIEHAQEIEYIYIYIYPCMCLRTRDWIDQRIKVLRNKWNVLLKYHQEFLLSPFHFCFSATTAINQNFKVILPPSLSLFSLLLFIPLVQPRYLNLSPA